MERRRAQRWAATYDDPSDVVRALDAYAQTVSTRCLTWPLIGAAGRTQDDELTGLCRQVIRDLADIESSLRRLTRELARLP